MLRGSRPRGDFAQGASTITHAGGAQHVPDAGQDHAPQAAGGVRHLRMEQRIHQGADPRDLPERDLLRPARLRRRRGGRGLLRQAAAASCRWPRPPRWPGCRRRPRATTRSPTRSAPPTGATTCCGACARCGYIDAATAERAMQRADQRARVRAAVRRRGALRGGDGRGRTWSRASARRAINAGYKVYHDASTAGCRPRPTARCASG